LTDKQNFLVRKIWTAQDNKLKLYGHTISCTKITKYTHWKQTMNITQN